MSINKILLAMALGLALTACSNHEQAADATADAAAAADAAQASADAAAATGEPAASFGGDPRPTRPASAPR